MTMTIEPCDRETQIEVTRRFAVTGAEPIGCPDWLNDLIAQYDDHGNPVVQ